MSEVSHGASERRRGGADRNPGPLQFVRCQDCGAATFPPQHRCRTCWSQHTVLVDLPNRGSIYSWTTGHSREPGCGDGRICLVIFQEGVVVPAVLVIPRDEEAEIGASVSMSSRASSEHGDVPTATLEVR